MNRYGRIFLYFISTWSLLIAGEWKVTKPEYSPGLEKSPLFRRIYFLNDQKGWVIGTMGQKNCLWSTENGAEKWTLRLVDFDVTFVDMKFVSPSHGYVLGQHPDSSIIYKTTDGGVTWKKKKPIHKFVSLYFIDTSIGLANTLDTIFRTQDGGKTWSVQKINFPYSFNVQRFFFTSSKKGWAIAISGIATDEDMVLQTIDSGKTWTSPLLRTSPLLSIFFINDTYGMVSGFSGMIRTIDGGKNWIFNHFTPRSSDIVFNNFNDGWCISDRGRIWHSTDTGVTWQLIQSEVLNNDKAKLNSLAFTNDNKTGFICGSNGFILKYTETSKINNSTKVIITNSTSSQYTLYSFLPHTSLSTFMQYYNLAGRKLSSEEISRKKGMPYLFITRQPKKK